MEFAAFAARCEEIEAASADTEITSLVADLLTAAEEELQTVVRFLLGRVYPAHDSTTLDIGPKLCYNALARAAGQNVSVEDIEAHLADEGDIGTVAEQLELGGQKGLAAFASGTETELTVTHVETTLRDLAETTGDGSQETKVDILFGLFNRASDREARYLARLVLSEMRIGVGEGTIRDATARAFEVPVDAVERALQVSNDYGLVAETARKDGVAGLESIQLEVGRPVQAMLAQTGTVTDALDSWDTVGVEWKYDGARVQVHTDGTDVSLYSRNMEDVTDALPEIVEFVTERVDEPAILDGEVVAVDSDGNPRPFQAVLRRFRRKHDIETAREDVEVRLHAFDCLYAGGEALLDAPLRDRHARLAAVVGESEEFKGPTGGEDAEGPTADGPAEPPDGVSRLWLSADAKEIERLEQEALAAGHEGLMLKDPDSTYTPGNRGQRWLKRKPDVETLDCVVTGAEWGEGRRANVLGTFELSVRDGETYRSIGKVATGITDEELAELSDLLEPHIRQESGTAVDIAPAVVFEVGYEEIQESPTYGSGYALRFPRFLGVRSDKSPADADTRARVESLVSDDQ